MKDSLSAAIFSLKARVMGVSRASSGVGLMAILAADCDCSFWSGDESPARGEASDVMRGDWGAVLGGLGLVGAVLGAPSAES